MEDPQNDIPPPPPILKKADNDIPPQPPVLKAKEAAPVPEVKKKDFSEGNPFQNISNSVQESASAGLGTSPLKPAKQSPSQSANGVVNNDLVSPEEAMQAKALYNQDVLADQNISQKQQAASQQYDVQNQKTSAERRQEAMRQSNVLMKATHEALYKQDPSYAAKHDELQAQIDEHEQKLAAMSPAERQDYLDKEKVQQDYNKSLNREDQLRSAAKMRGELAEIAAQPFKTVDNLAREKELNAHLQNLETTHKAEDFLKTNNPDFVLSKFGKDAEGHNGEVLRSYLTDMMLDNPDGFQNLKSIAEQGKLDDHQKVQWMQKALVNTRGQQIEDANILANRGDFKLIDELDQKTRSLNELRGNIQKLQAATQAPGFDPNSQQGQAVVQQLQQATQTHDKTAEDLQNLNTPENIAKVKTAQQTLNNIQKTSDEMKNNILSHPEEAAKFLKQQALNKDPDNVLTKTGKVLWNNAVDALTGLVAAAKVSADAVAGVAGKDINVNRLNDDLIRKYTDIAENNVKFATDQTPWVYKGEDGKTQVNWAQSIPNVLGGLEQLGFLVYGGGEAAKLMKGAKYAEQLGVGASAFASSVDGYYKEGLDKFNGDKQAASNFAFSSAAINGAMFAFFNPYEFQKALSWTNPEMKEATKLLMSKEPSAAETAMKVFLEKPTEAAALTVSQQVVDHSIGAAMNNAYKLQGDNKFETTFNDANLTETLANVVASTWIVEGLGHKFGPSHEDHQLAAEFKIGQDPAAYMKFIEGQVSSGKMEQSVADQLLQVSKSANELIQKMPSDLEENKKVDIYKQLKIKAEVKAANEGLDPAFQNKDAIVKADEEIRNIKLADDPRVLLLNDQIKGAKDDAELTKLEARAKEEGIDITSVKDAIENRRAEFERSPAEYSTTGDHNETFYWKRQDGKLMESTKAEYDAHVRELTPTQPEIMAAASPDTKAAIDEHITPEIAQAIKEKGVTPETMPLVEKLVQDHLLTPQDLQDLKLYQDATNREAESLGDTAKGIDKGQGAEGAPGTEKRPNEKQSDAGAKETGGNGPVANKKPGASKGRPSKYEIWGKMFKGFEPTTHEAAIADFLLFGGKVGTKSLKHEMGVPYSDKEMSLRRLQRRPVKGDQEWREARYAHDANGEPIDTLAMSEGVLSERYPNLDWSGDEREQIEKVLSVIQSHRGASDLLDTVKEDYEKQKALYGNDHYDQMTKEDELQYKQWREAQEATDLAHHNLTPEEHAELDHIDYHGISDNVSEALRDVSDQQKVKFTDDIIKSYISADGTLDLDKLQQDIESGKIKDLLGDDLEANIKKVIDNESTGKHGQPAEGEVRSAGNGDSGSEERGPSATAEAGNPAAPAEGETTSREHSPAGEKPQAEEGKTHRTEEGTGGDNEHPGRNGDQVETLAAKELRKQLDAAQEEHTAAKNALSEKRKELDKTILADQEDLFGERKSNEEPQLFDERVDQSERAKVLAPLEARLEKAQNVVTDLQEKLAKEKGNTEDDLFTSKAERLAARLRENIIPDSLADGPEENSFFGLKDRKIVNAAFEMVAKIVEGGGKLIDAIRKAIDYIRGSDPYSKFSKEQREKLEKGFKSHVEEIGERFFENENAIELQEKFAKLKEKFEGSPSETRKELQDFVRDNYAAIRELQDGKVHPLLKMINEARTKPALEKAITNLERAVNERGISARLERAYQERGEHTLDPKEKSKYQDEALAHYDKKESDWLGEKQLATHLANVEAGNLQEEIKATVPKKEGENALAYKKRWTAIDKAIQIHLDLKGSPEDRAKFYDMLTPEQKHIVDLSENLSPEQKAIAEKISAEYKKTGQAALDAGQIKNMLDNYVARAWDFKGKPATDIAPFKTSTKHALQRTLTSILEGQSKGYDLKIEGATNNLQVLKTEIAHAIENKKLIEEGSRIKTASGDPLFSSSQREGYKKIENPNFRKWEYDGKLSDYSPEQAQLLGKNKDVLVTEDGTVMRKKEIYAPEEVAKGLNNILGKSKLNESNIIKAVSGFSNAVKGIIFTTSLYHHLAFARAHFLASGAKGMEYWSPRKAYKTGLSMIHEIHPEVSLLVKQGMTLGKMQDYDEMAQQKKNQLSNYLDKKGFAPELRERFSNLLENQNKFLFEKYGAGLKALDGVNALRDLVKKNPEVSPEEHAATVARYMNQNYGGLNLERMKRNPTAQHAFRLLALAPDWTESNIQMARDAFRKGELGSFERKMWARVAIRGAGAVALANLATILASDKTDEKGNQLSSAEAIKQAYKKAWDAGHLQWLKWDVTPIMRSLGGSKDKRTYFSFFGHFSDPVKMIEDPVSFFEAKTNPTTSKPLLELLTGENWQHKAFTTASELSGKDDKGMYSKTHLRGDHPHFRGEEKGGKLEFKLTKPAIGGAKPLTYTQLPSFMVSQARGMFPSQVQNIEMWASGENDAAYSIAQSLGLGLSESSEPKEKKKHH